MASVPMINSTAEDVIRIQKPGCGAVSADGSLWLEYREIVYAIAERLGCKPFKDEILRALGGEVSHV